MKNKNFGINFLTNLPDLTEIYKTTGSLLNFKNTILEDPNMYSVNTKFFSVVVNSFNIILKIFCIYILSILIFDKIKTSYITKKEKN